MVLAVARRKDLCRLGGPHCCGKFRLNKKYIHLIYLCSTRPRFRPLFSGESQLYLRTYIQEHGRPKINDSIALGWQKCGLFLPFKVLPKFLSRSLIAVLPPPVLSTCPLHTNS
ncbi:unnamed protein product, partial [Ascophyllum nodosum]